MHRSTALWLDFPHQNMPIRQSSRGSFSMMYSTNAKSIDQVCISSAAITANGGAIFPSGASTVNSVPNAPDMITQSSNAVADL